MKKKIISKITAISIASLASTIALPLVITSCSSEPIRIDVVGNSSQTLHGTVHAKFKFTINYANDDIERIKTFDSYQIEQNEANVLKPFSSFPINVQNNQFEIEVEFKLCPTANISKDFSFKFNYLSHTDGSQLSLTSPKLNLQYKVPEPRGSIALNDSKEKTLTQHGSVWYTSYNFKFSDDIAHCPNVILVKMPEGGHSSNICLYNVGQSHTEITVPVNVDSKTGKLLGFDVPVKFIDDSKSETQSINKLVIDFLNGITYELDNLGLSIKQHS